VSLARIGEERVASFGDQHCIDERVWVRRDISHEALPSLLRKAVAIAGAEFSQRGFGA
jgi:hypothetical protein